MTSFTASAPARANLIGEHTDYAPNGGHVLPTPLPFHTTVTIEPNGTDRFTFVSEKFPGKVEERGLEEAARGGHWTDYILGVLRVCSTKVKVPGLKISVTSDVPIGCGISSSAALCVAVARAVKALTGASWDDVEIALIAYEAEHDYVGVPCGKMDQFASSVGREGQALLLDTRTLEFRNVAMPEGVTLMLVECGHRHDLAKGDGHKERIDRFHQCEEACEKLGVKVLAELDYKDLPRLEALRPIVAQRARHAITENRRVLEMVEAIEKGDHARQAELLAQSHISQRDDFEVSIPAIDALVESSWEFGVRAARLCGGGFGGAIIALVPNEKVDAWWEFVSKQNPNAGLITTSALSKGKNEHAA
ncbi:galactokinase [Rhizomicrobium palustre]|uniref:Galactokinase n=1 Tax=Rhizomicrobium palustre TaxID=189966 RepID=A0A846N1W1_9PROT|nr:galactokinase [Rhizomicrobium palustre]NIK89100.1 galactokinase [Rhizomicrobium palustre]